MMDQKNGELDALIRYYIRSTDARLRDIEIKIDALISYRTFLLGASAVVSALMTVLLTYLFGGK